MRPTGVSLVAVCLFLVGCGDEKTRTVTKVVTVTEPAETPPDDAAALTASPKRPGEIIVEGEGGENHGPYTFRQAIYRVRFEQFAPESPGLDFRRESSSFGAQLHRKPGLVEASTIHLFNATKKTGGNQVTVPGGKFYVDVEADHSYALRFTPKRR